MLRLQFVKQSTFKRLLVKLCQTCQIQMAIKIDNSINNREVIFSDKSTSEMLLRKVVE